MDVGSVVGADVRADVGPDVRSVVGAGGEADIGSDFKKRTAEVF